MRVSCQGPDIIKKGLPSQRDHTESGHARMLYEGMKMEPNPILPLSVVLSLVSYCGV